MEYLIGTGIVGLFWLLPFILRRDLRKPMLWSGVVYAIGLSVAFGILRLGSVFGDVGGLVVPDYWDPDTLFNLGRITGGLAIEDVIFMFFIGGIATSLYELFSGKKIRIKRHHRHHIGAFVVAALVTAAYAIALKPNPIYPFIAFGVVSSIVVWSQRPDLFRHSVVGGIAFMVSYIAMFQIFNLIFPSFISEVYNLAALSGKVILGVPLEEYLFSLSFGLLWSPIYEYIHEGKSV